MTRLLGSVQVKNGQLEIVAAVFDNQTGRVEFMGLLATVRPMKHTSFVGKRTYPSG